MSTDNDAIIDMTYYSGAIDGLARILLYFPRLRESLV